MRSAARRQRWPSVPAQLRTRGLLDDPRFSTNEARVQHAGELDEAIAGAIAARTLDENLAIIDDNHLTAVPVQTVADIERDWHWQPRDLIVNVQNGDGPVRMHNVFPRLSATPGEIRWTGGALGQDNAGCSASWG